MARPVTILVVFFISLNLLAAIFTGIGLAAFLGINSHVGGDQVTKTATQQQKVPTGSPTGNTLFGSWNVLLNFLSPIFDTIYPGIGMLHHAGVPAYITTGLLSPLASFMILIDLVSFYKGWGL